MRYTTLKPSLALTLNYPSWAVGRCLGSEGTGLGCAPAGRRGSGAGVGGGKHWLGRRERDERLQGPSSGSGVAHSIPDSLVSGNQLERGRPMSMSLGSRQPSWPPPRASTDTWLVGPRGPGSVLSPLGSSQGAASRSRPLWAPSETFTFLCAQSVNFRGAGTADQKGQALGSPGFLRKQRTRTAPPAPHRPWSRLPRPPPSPPSPKSAEPAAAAPRWAPGWGPAPGSLGRVG